MDTNGKDLQDMLDKIGLDNFNEAVLDAIGPRIAKYLDDMGIDSARYLRYMPVGHEMKRVREEMNISIREASLRLKIPQYRIKSLERGTFSEIKPEFFLKYARFLGIEDFVFTWAKKYPETAEKLGVETGDPQESLR